MSFEDESELEKFERRIREDGLENSSKRFYSYYRGTVTNITDPLQRGRINFRLDLVSDVPEFPVLAEPLPIFAGPGFGIFFPPRIGDEIHVMFEFGDINQPFYTGGYWANPTGALSDLPAEVFNPITPLSTRLIKTPAGHALIFEDGEPTKIANKRVELHTAENTAPIGAPPVFRVLHRLVMSDLAGTILLQTAGSAPGVSHEILLDDGRKFLHIKSSSGHLLDMDDRPGLRSVTLSTSGGHQIVMDETPGTLGVRIITAGKSSIILDDTPGKQNVTISTPQKKTVMLDDTGPGKILVQDGKGNIVTMSPTGVAVVSAAAVTVAATGACSVTAGGAVSVTGAGVSQTSLGGPTSAFSTGTVTSFFLGLKNATVIGLVSAILLGGLSLIVPGLVNVVAVLVSISAAQISLGTGTQVKLLNANLLVWLATHLHLSTAPGAPTSTPVQAAALADPSFVTQNVTAS